MRVSISPFFSYLYSIIIIRLIQSNSGENLCFDIPNPTTVFLLVNCPFGDLNIARRYLLPKQFENNGLKPGQAKMSDGAILDLIRHYTREAGVRNLEREIAKVTRKLVTEIALTEGVRSKKGRKAEQGRAVRISSKSIEKYNGVQRFKYGLADAEDRVGVVGIHKGTRTVVDGLSR